MERAEGGEGKSGDGGKTSFEIFTLCHSYSLMDSLGRDITTSLWPYHPPCLFFLSPSIVEIFFKETRQVLNCVLNQLLLMPAPGRDCTLLFKIGNISVF